MIVETKRKIILKTLSKIARSKNISHAEIEKRTGIERPNITRMLSGKGSISIDNLLVLAEAIDVKIFDSIINAINNSKDGK